MIQLAIQHHPKRIKHLELLKTFLDLDQVDKMAVVTDEVNSASGMRQCLQWVYNGDPSLQLIVLQDDALPCRNLLATCKVLAALRPRDFISLYSDFEYITNAVKTNRRWVNINTAWGLVGYIIPAYMAREYIAFEPKIRDVYADDVKMSIFLREHNYRTFITAPNLVDHVCWYETSQGFKRIQKVRVSNYFIGLEHSGLDYDWSNLDSLVINLERDHRRQLK